MYGTNQNRTDFFNASSHNDNMLGMRSLQTAREIAKRNPNTYSIRHFSGGEFIIRETADCIRTAEYNYRGNGVSCIRHQNKKTGRKQLINTFGDYIENPNPLKPMEKEKVRHFAGLNELLKYSRKKQKQLKFLNTIKNIFKPLI
ncbi:hypothetical protein IJ674_09430 [bacterium]|nr:hypothetical protein [bacterium]